MNDTISAIVSQQASWGSKTFLAIDADQISYADVNTRSARIASALITSGVARGSRVGMLMGNSTDFALAFLAITRIGAVPLPFSTISTPSEIKGLLANSDCEFLITAKSYRGRDFRDVLRDAIGAVPSGTLMLPAIPTLRQIWFGVSELEARGKADDPLLTAAQDQVSPSDTLMLVHTSGSTSAPKGVIHTHGQVIRNMRRQNATRGLTENEVLFSNSPWFWVGGLAYSLLATMIAGARLLCSSAKPADMLDFLRVERPTMCNGVASTMLALAQDPSFATRDFSFLRRGNLYPIMPADVRPRDPELRYNLLGMTEAGSVCLVGDSEDDLPEEKRGAFGKLVQGIEARIVDPESGLDAPSGELWLRGPNVMQGYYGRERSDTFDADGWYHSGDMFRVDEGGDYFFLGRTGDIIRTSGAQVSPREVEAALSDITGGRTAIVIGVPDDARGQLVTAVMVGADPVDAEQLQSALRERLSPYKVPRRFLTIEESRLPTLSSGKIDLKMLVEIAREA